MKIFLLIVAIAMIVSGTSMASENGSGTFQVVGIVKRLEDDAVVLRVKERNIRLSKRFFEDQALLAVGEIATAHYTMTFKAPSSRKPSSN